MQRQRRTLAEGLEPKRECRIVGCLRRLTWADIGGKPHVEPEAPLQEVVRACINKAYAGANMILKVQELRSKLKVQNERNRCTNALTGATTTNRRRPCRYPVPRQLAIPQNEWRPPSPGATPLHVEDMQLFDYHGPHYRVEAPVARSEDVVVNEESNGYDSEVAAA